MTRGARIGAILATLAMPGFGMSDTLKGPFDLTLLDQLSSVSMGSPQAVECPAEIAPVISLSTESRYDPNDGKAAAVDQARSTAYNEAIQPVRNFTRLVSSTANRSVSDPLLRAGWADCALSHLHQWAVAGALTDLQSPTARLINASHVAGYALSYLQIRSAVVDDPRRDAVEAWIAALAQAGADFIETRPTAKSSRANHRYWHGLAMAASGIVTNDRAMLDWGLDSARLGLSQVTAEGYLPLELDRDKRALAYHLYALAPLVMTAEIARANDQNLYTAFDGALPRLAETTIAAVGDPSEISARALAEQTIGPQNPPKAHELAWLVPYAKQTASPAARTAKGRFPKLTHSSLGGNLSLLYAQPGG